MSGCKIRPNIVIAVFIVLALMLVTAGCTQVRTTDNNDASFMGRNVVWTDDGTGVEYVIATSTYGIGICPRYDAEGNLMIDGGDGHE